MSSFFLKKRRELVELKRQLNKSSSPTSILEVTLGEFMKQMFYEFQWGRIESWEGFIFRDGRGGSRLAKLHDSDLRKVGVKAY